MNSKLEPPPLLPLEVAQRIHQKCEQFEDAWCNSARPQLGDFLTEVEEPERTWLLAELLSVEVELRQGAGEQPTEVEYQQVFPGEGDRNVIGIAFRCCADCQCEARRIPRIEGAPVAASSRIKEPGPPAFTIPRELQGHARYLVLGPLGSGGMGTVYKARHRLMNRVVALKVVNPILVNKPGAVERFGREVRAAAQLVHPNIVTAYDAEEVGDLHLLSMELVEGQTLAQVLAREHQLPVARACEYLRQTALGLQHALDHGMVHRDIKPHNLMLVASPDESAPGVIKVLDFGLARFVSEHALADGSTEVGTLLGSPDYMAPEQEHDAHSADARADIYGMGCTLYHLLAGQVPFPGKSLLAKLEAHRDQLPIPLDQVRADVPHDLARVVAKMMAKAPAQRYQTPAEVAEALRPFALSQAASSARLVEPARRSRKPIFAVAIAAGLLFAALVYWMAPMVFRGDTPEGTLRVKTDDPDVQISVKSSGMEVARFFPRERKEVPLKLGEYTLELVGGKEGLKLSTNRFEIRSGNDQMTVTVEFVPTVADEKKGASLKFQFTDTNGGKIIGRIEGLANRTGTQTAAAVWVDRVFQLSATGKDYPPSHTLPFNFGPGGSFQVVGGRITEAHFSGYRTGNPAVQFTFDHGTPRPFFNMHSFNNHADQRGSVMEFESLSR